MTKPAYAPEDIGPFWRVRVCLPGSIIHLASRTEPKVWRHCGDGPLDRVEMDLLEGTEHGDNLGFINWSAVLAVTYRFAPEKPVEEPDPMPQPEPPRPRRRRRDKEGAPMNKVCANCGRAGRLDGEPVRRGVPRLTDAGGYYRCNKCRDAAIAWWKALQAYRQAGQENPDGLDSRA